MNWTNSPAAENQPGSDDRLSQESYLPTETRVPPLPVQPGVQGSSAVDTPPHIRIGKSSIRSDDSSKATSLEIFTLTLGEETIDLLPLKNWGQLDHYKWTVRGKLPAAPSGLEVGLDHVRVAGETVALNDPEGCEKLERLFNEWLLLERETVELARKKAHPQPVTAAPASTAQPISQSLCFRVEVDKSGQVHIHCLRGKETLASIGLTTAGFKSLYQQGLMRKPRTLATGALHNWVELDGELCSFEKGRNDATRLEQILNERYAPAASVGPSKEVVVYLNPASSTGFDIEFPMVVAGVPDNHRRHLDEQSLELLQDPEHCGLLHREIIIKLIPPNLVFKQKTPDGGERYLTQGPEYTVNVIDEEGNQETIPLSQPLNLMRLGRAKLAAVFNHPAINRHTQAAPPPNTVSEAQPKLAVPGPASPASPPHAPPMPPPFQQAALPEVRERGTGLAEIPPLGLAPESAPKPPVAEPVSKLAGLARSLPNFWLKEILAQPALSPDWFTCLVYSKIAERFGNSEEGKFGPCDCWFIALGEPEDIADPSFKGIFLTEKRSLGFLNGEQMARFYHRVAFLGTQHSALEGIQVDLVAVGLDAQERVVFILSDNYAGTFGVPKATLTEVLERLRESGAVVMGVTEALASPEPLEVVWTVPAEQSDPRDPQALESTRVPA